MAGAGPTSEIPFGTSGPLNRLWIPFLGGNGGAVGGAIYFDVQGFNDCIIHGLELNTGIGAGTPIEADIYVYPGGTHILNETDPTLWSAWTVAKGTASAPNTPSPVVLNRGLSVPAGTTCGVAIVARNFDHDYTSSTGGPFYGDANLAIIIGSATNVPFTAPVFLPRTPNIAALYHLDPDGSRNTISQHMVRAVDLGGAGRITGLSFASTTSGRHYNQQLRIRFAHRPAGYNLVSTFVTNIAGAATVLDATDYAWNVSANQWSQVGLTSGFDYNGTDDLVVEVLARGNHMSFGSPGEFRRGTGPRVVASGWSSGAPPIAGTVDSLGAKMRVEFGCGGAREYETSCGPAGAFHRGSPNPGVVFDYGLIDAVPNSGAIIRLGFLRTSTSLTTFGLTNCSAWTDNVATDFKVVGAGGVALHPVAIPPSSAFHGVAVYGQWFNLDGSAAGGLTATNVTRMMIGAVP